MKEGTGTRIAVDAMNTIKIAGSRCRGGLTLIELMVMIAMSSRRGVCASESFADLAERRAIGGHTVGPLLFFLFASALSANGGPAGPQFSVQDLGPLEATFISKDG